MICPKCKKETQILFNYSTVGHVCRECKEEIKKKSGGFMNMDIAAASPMGRLNGPLMPGVK